MYTVCKVLHHSHSGRCSGSTTSLASVLCTYSRVLEYTGMDFTSVLEFSESNPKPLPILDVHVLAMQGVVYRPVNTWKFLVPEV